MNEQHANAVNRSKSFFTGIVLGCVDAKVVKN
jgi:hypothetical protein